ncbi:MAG: hypothetical protein QOI95_1047 [Acidimicrobiaceae bacterium]|jgi:hypothetical protein
MVWIRETGYVGELGDLLEVISGSPHARTVHTVGRMWSDPGAFHEVFAAWNHGHGANVAIGIASTGSEPPDAVTGSRIETWWTHDGRTRVDRDGQVAITTPDEVLVYTPGHGGIRSRPDERHGSAPLIGAAPLLGWLDFEIEQRATWENRNTWDVLGRPSVGRAFFGIPPWLHELMGVEFRLGIDAATGLILHAQGTLNGSVVSWMALDDVVVDEPVTDDMFQFTPPNGERIRSNTEMLVEHLQSLGVDVSAVDPEDEQQVHDLMRRWRESQMPSHHRQPTLDELAANHVVTGPLPVDEPAERERVEHVIKLIGTASDDGEDVPAVDRGEGLGVCLRTAASRVNATEPTVIEVDHMKFLNDREAVVWYSLSVGTNRYIQRQEARAIRVDGDWFVSRASFCELMARAGVTCPPPAE